ncbi:Uncharacterised protein [Serratia liquefaciens]|nr:Uncharacterised protein [Serratia liquefaciens]
MSNRHVMEALLRPAVELNTAIVAGARLSFVLSRPGRWRWRLK